jgi:thiol-disulfide isomerase/thioredoxin
MLSMLSRISRPAWLALGLVPMLGLGGLYLSTQAGRNPHGAQACAVSPAVQAGVAKAAIGELAAFQPAATPRPMADLAFLDAAGAGTSLAQMRGRMVLLNLWATWCAPCRKEMPALDALQGEFGGPDFEVVAINIDTRNLERPRTWLTENGITRLAYYADPQAKVFQELKRAGQAIGMPTTLLIDAGGCQLGVLHGPAEWHSEDARRLVKAALGR